MVKKLKKFFPGKERIPLLRVKPPFFAALDGDKSQFSPKDLWREKIPVKKKS